MIDAITDFTSRLSAAIIAAERKIEAARRDLSAAEGELRGLVIAREQFDLTKEVVALVERRTKDEMNAIWSGVLEK